MLFGWNLVARSNELGRHGTAMAAGGFEGSVFDGDCASPSGFRLDFNA